MELKANTSGFFFSERRAGCLKMGQTTIILPIVSDATDNYIQSILLLDDSLAV